MTIVTMHKFNEVHLSEVMKIAKQVGSVKVNVYDTGETIYCLEGVHRIEAAKLLGLPLTLVAKEWDDVVATDSEDVEGYENGTATVSAIFEYAYGNQVEGGIYSESDFVNVEMV